MRRLMRRMKLRKAAWAVTWTGVALFFAGLLTVQWVVYDTGLFLAATGYVWVLTLNQREL